MIKKKRIINLEKKLYSFFHNTHKGKWLEETNEKNMFTTFFWKKNALLSSSLWFYNDSKINKKMLLCTNVRRIKYQIHKQLFICSLVCLFRGVGFEMRMFYIFSESWIEREREPCSKSMMLVWTYNFACKWKGLKNVDNLFSGACKLMNRKLSNKSFLFSFSIFGFSKNRLCD